MKVAYVCLLALSFAAVPACAQVDLHIRLDGKGPIVRNPVHYTCDRNAARLDLPIGRFVVEYIEDGGDNGLVILPIKGKRLIFAHVMSADGARFTAGPYEWWNKGNDASFTSEWLADKKVSSTECHEVK